MSVPCQVEFKFGQGFEGDLANIDPVFTAELKDRVSKLITGQFQIDAEGRCIIEPMPWKEGVATRDSVCGGISIGPISISYCKDI